MSVPGLRPLRTDLSEDIFPVPAQIGAVRMVAPVSSWIAGEKEDVDHLYDDRDVAEQLRSARGGEGGDAIVAILGRKAFDFPKPPSLMRALVQQATAAGDIVVDFFAGSGTTAQAVLELNKKDSGARRFILVSSTEATEDEPEKNICRDVCASDSRGRCGRC